jgi:hypothetical protein
MTAFTPLLCDLPLSILYCVYVIILFFHAATAASKIGPLSFRGFTIILRHTTLGRTPLDE